MAASQPAYDGPAVRVVLARAGTSPQTRIVPATEVDDVLREALASGWSVREVCEVPEVREAVDPPGAPGAVS